MTAQRAVSLTSIATMSKTIDPTGRGVSPSAILGNSEASRVLRASTAAGTARGPHDRHRARLRMAPAHASMPTATSPAPASAIGAGPRIS